MRHTFAVIISILFAGHAFAQQNLPNPFLVECHLVDYTWPGTPVEYEANADIKMEDPINPGSRGRLVASVKSDITLANGERVQFGGRFEGDIQEGSTSEVLKIFNIGQFGTYKDKDIELLSDAPRRTLEITAFRTGIPGVFLEWGSRVYVLKADKFVASVRCAITGKF